MSIRSVKNIQKIINIPKAYTAEERRAIASEVIQYIKSKTDEGVSPITGKKFKGYTKLYEKSLALSFFG